MIRAILCIIPHPDPIEGGHQWGPQGGFNVGALIGFHDSVQTSQVYGYNAPTNPTRGQLTIDWPILSCRPRKAVLAFQKCFSPAYIAQHVRNEWEKGADSAISE